MLPPGPRLETELAPNLAILILYNFGIRVNAGSEIRGGKFVDPGLGEHLGRP